MNAAPAALFQAVADNACRDGQLSVIASIRELLDRGDDTRARKAVESLPAVDNACTAFVVARLALAGWFEARALAIVGGAADQHPIARKSLDQLDRLRASTMSERDRLEIEYAHTIIRAAIAAAQDERPEMELLLGHALDLVQRLRLRGGDPVWPRSYNLAAGELWFEVDRYDESRAAFERVVRADASPAALIGLARALARSGRVEEACAVRKRVRDAAAELLAKAKADLPRCP